MERCKCYQYIVCYYASRLLCVSIRGDCITPLARKYAPTATGCYFIVFGCCVYLCMHNHFRKGVRSSPYTYVVIHPRKESHMLCNTKYTPFQCSWSISVDIVSYTNVRDIPPIHVLHFCQVHTIKKQYPRYTPINIQGIYIM